MYERRPTPTRRGTTRGHEHGTVDGGLKGTQFYFDTVSVTGTANLMMAASLADGETILENAAKEPEVVFLADILNQAGAKIVDIGVEITTPYSNFTGTTPIIEVGDTGDVVELEKKHVSTVKEIKTDLRQTILKKQLYLLKMIEKQIIKSIFLFKTNLLQPTIS